MSTNVADCDKVVQYSKFLAKILRHTPEDYGLQLNSRGWASLKEVRMVIQDEFPDETPVKIIKEVIANDEHNRFQVKTGSDNIFGFIRATRNHTTEQVSLEKVCPDEHELKWYQVTFLNSMRKDAWIEATSKEVGEKIIQERLGITDDMEFSETGKKYWNHGVKRDSLSGNKPPFEIVHQHGEKPLTVEKQVNQAGESGRLVRPQPQRVRSRLPD